MATALFDKNSHLLKITGLANAATGQAVTTGVTVTAVLVPAGSTTPVTGGSISLTFVTGSTGDWQGTFPSDVGVALGSTYRVIVTADGGTSLRGEWIIPVRVQERT